MKSLTALSLALATSGCAVGYGVGTKSRAIGVGDEGSTLTYQNSAAKVSGFYHEFRIIDTTGLLLAALVNAGKAQTARDEAIEKAQYQTPDQNGEVTVTVRYDPMPILSGLLTDLRFRIGFGEQDLELPAGAAATGGMSFWEFDLRPEFYTFRPIKRLPMVSSLFLGMLAGQITAPEGNVDRELDLFNLDLTAGASTTYLVTPNLAATGRVAIGFISPIIGGLIGEGILYPSAELELGWRPFSTEKVGVIIGGSAQIARDSAFTRSMTTTRLGLNATITFGMQAPKRPQTTETPPPPVVEPTVASAPTTVCQDTVSDCYKIETTSPEPVRTLFIECARATQTAAQTKQLGDQPALCRKHGEAIAQFYRDHEATLDPEMKRLVDVAAMSVFTFSAAGYQATGGETSPDACAMIELAFNSAVRSSPESVPTLNAEISKCRGQ